MRYGYQDLISLFFKHRFSFFTKKFNHNNRDHRMVTGLNTTIPP